MMRLLSCTLLLLAMCLVPTHANGAVTLSKSLTHYARDMEFYYQKPRPETLAGILRTFDSQGTLSDNRKQLTLAAFFAQVLRSDHTARQYLLPMPDSIGRDGRRTMAWAVHLAQLPDETALMDHLLTNQESLLRAQIAKSPAPLTAWDIRSEKTVVQMFWTAFLAAGDTQLLDRIVETALRYAHLQAMGMQNTRDFAVCSSAAASLYDMTPRHPIVRARLENLLPHYSGPEAETLRTILRQ